MKLSPQQIRMMYSHYPDPDLDEDDFWPMMGILAVILLAWTGIIHLLDWLTFDFIPWWVEPFTIAPLIFLLAMKEVYDSINPLHWWPMFWGTRIMIDRESDWHIAFDSTEFVKNNGGRYNAYCGWDSNEDLYIKFRKKRDAVVYSLRNL